MYKSNLVDCTISMKGVCVPLCRRNRPLRGYKIYQYILLNNWYRQKQTENSTLTPRGKNMSLPPVTPLPVIEGLDGNGDRLDWEC